MAIYFETLMVMASILYGIILSPAWLWLFPAAMAHMAIRHYFKNQK